jgi:hypothetical protein
MLAIKRLLIVQHGQREETEVVADDFHKKTTELTKDIGRI